MSPVTLASSCSAIEMDRNYRDIRVTDRKSFEEFVDLLLKDFRKNGDEWENNRLELFLEAVKRYSEDLDGYYRNLHPELDADVPTWRAFADILRGAVVYE